MKIKKIKQAIGIVGNVVDSLDATGENDVPNVKAVNSIIESGSNDKGHYIKFSDGTLIQRGTLSYPSGVDSYELSFPIPFKDTDYQISTETAFEHYRVVDLVRSVKSTNSIILFASALKTSASPHTWIFELEYTQHVDWIAIGEWK